MLKKITKNSNLIFILLIAVFAVPSIISLLHSGFPLTDDGNWMVIRFSAFYESLRAGQFPVRFLSRLNYNFGYPVSDFLYPLFMYLGVPIHVLGLNFFTTIKAILILSLFSSAVFSFFWLRKIFDNLSSFIGAIIYLYFPYHLFDTYARGSVGEVLSLAILPFVLWQTERGNLALTSLGVALLAVSHNTLSILFLPLIFIYKIVREKKISRFNIVSIVLGLLASSFFWIPAIYDSRFTVFGKTGVSDFSSYFVNGNLGLLGIIFAFIILEGVFFLFKKRDKLFLGIFITSLILCFLTFSQSEFLWNLFPFKNLIQFPFRIISLLVPISAFLVAYLLSKENKIKKQILICIYLILVFISAWNFIHPPSFQNYEDSFYSTNQDSTTVKNEYMPVWVKKLPTAMADKKVVSFKGEEAVNTTLITPNKIVFNTSLTQDRTIQVNTIYFPGWEAFVNGKKADISYNNEEGLIRINLLKGKNDVSVKFSETPVRIFSDLISIIGVILIFSINFLNKKFKLKLI